MKKRKVKLFASIASLAMVVAVMGVGVWAATQQSVAISSTVGFQATGIEGTVALQATGTSVNTAKIGEQDIKTTAQNIATFALTDAQDKVTNVAVTIDLYDHTGDGFFTAEDGKITYSFTITNTSATVGMYYKISVAEANENWSAEIKTSTDPVQVTNGNPETATVEFTYVYAGETPKNAITAGQTMPTITIAFASSDVWTVAP